jgi:hypothetical protein
MSALGHKRTSGRLRISNEHPRAGQNNPDFGELARLRIDLDCARMLLDDDVVADGEAKAGAFSRRLGREERVEHLFLHVRRDAGTVIAYPNFYTIAKVFGRRREGRLVVVDLKTQRLGPRSVPCEIEAFLNERIDMRRGAGCSAQIGA